MYHHTMIHLSSGRKYWKRERGQIRVCQRKKFKVVSEIHSLQRRETYCSIKERNIYRCKENFFVTEFDGLKGRNAGER